MEARLLWQPITQIHQQTIVRLIQSSECGKMQSAMEIEIIEKPKQQIKSEKQFKIYIHKKTFL